MNAPPQNFHNKLMQKNQPSPYQNENIERRRRSQSKYNKDLPRYECFCTKQYLSYPALYLHMKNKHIDYFQSSKSGRVEPTKLIESFNPTEGYKVYKIAGDSVYKEMHAKYFDQGFMDNSKPNFYMNSNGNYMRFPNMTYHNYGYMLGNNNENQEKTTQKEAVIEMALSMYIHTLKEKPFKQRHQTELFFVLFVDCLNKNYELLKDSRAANQEVRRYTAEYNCEKIMQILPFFQIEYLPSMMDASKPTSFFVKHSHIIKSGEYKSVLSSLVSFIYDKPAKHVIQGGNGKIVIPPQLPFSDNEQSQEPSRNGDGEDDDDEDDDENSDENYQES